MPSISKYLLFASSLIFGLSACGGKESSDTVFDVVGDEGTTGDTNTESSEVDEDGDGSTVADGDCDDSDSSLNTKDNDGDGYSTCDGDCNDSEDDIHPGALEYCGATDFNCDGSSEDDATDKLAWYKDMDKDGYGESSGPATYACSNPSTASETYVDNNNDCNDAEDGIHPGATDPACDGIDQNCDGDANYGGTNFEITIFEGEIPCRYNVETDSNECGWDDGPDTSPDPYVEVKFADITYLTSTVDDQYYPLWGETYEGEVTSNTSLTVGLYDSDTYPDDDDLILEWELSLGLLQQYANCGRYRLEKEGITDGWLEILIAGIE